MKTLKLFVGVLILLMPLKGFCQNANPDFTDNNSSWKFDVAPYLWLTSIKGNIGFQNQTVPVEAAFKDIFNQLSFAALVHTEVQKDNWTIMTDIIYMKLKEQGATTNGLLSAELEIEQVILELGTAYTFIKIPDFLDVDALVGLRYVGIDPTLSVNQQTGQNRNLNFTDPYFGMRFQSVHDKWINSARFDVGGLGIGSKISWKLNLLIGYKFSKLLSLHLGYQGYDVDYEDDNSFTYNMYTGGFITGLNFSF